MNEQRAESFFQQSHGQWRSQRRYYTLKSGESQEVTSYIQVEFLEKGCLELVELSRLHQLNGDRCLLFGARASWESHYSGPSNKQSSGSTIFGVLGDTLYRDRGFATPQPVTASFFMRGDRTMCLRTEYNKSSFEEELKLIGTEYRTRQTIISRAGEEIMIGQYLETRIRK